MTRLLSFPPYGRMVAEFEERLGQGEAPDDWSIDEDWPTWRGKVLEIITLLLWPVYDFNSLTWQGAAAARMQGLTEGDFHILEGLRPYIKLNVPNIARPISHFEMFQLEDRAENMLELEAGVDRGVDRTLRYYLEGQTDQLTIDTLARWIESGMLRKAGSLPVQLKRDLQRPRAYQISDALGRTWFTHHQAMSSVSPSIISGHAFKGCTMGVASFYHATALSCPPPVFDALARIAMDFGDRRVFAGVHYPSDNIASWIAALLICQHVCSDGGRLGRQFLWQAISTKSTVYSAISYAVDQRQAADHQPSLQLLRELGAKPDMDIDDALSWAKLNAKPAAQSLTLAAGAE
ncbi:MAG: phosphatase PAP2 family protein [Alphaproteobacteria bacterium]